MDMATSVTSRRKKRRLKSLNDFIRGLLDSRQFLELNMMRGFGVRVIIHRPTRGFYGIFNHDLKPGVGVSQIFCRKKQIFWQPDQTG